MTAVLVFTALVFCIGAVLSLAHRFLVDYGSCRITVIEGERRRTIETEGGQPLLGALQDAGIRIPSSCGGQGSCGFCRVRLVEPKERPCVTELPFLSPADRREGIRLACRYRLVRDCVIELPDHLALVRKLVKEGRIDEQKRWRITIE